jgi:hypothetical protein
MWLPRVLNKILQNQLVYTDTADKADTLTRLIRLTQLLLYFYTPRGQFGRLIRTGTYCFS